ncbi:MAG: nucleoside monophosphate kinase, partial [Anaerolineae bacterium]
MSIVVVLLGPPGSGKGTQAKRLVDVLGTPHVSSGDLFRHHLSEGTELGRLAKSYMEEGGLVPDDVTVQMVIERISQPDCDEGVILDGFPRTLTQADALEESLREQGQEVTVVPLVSVGDEEVMRRLTARRVCPDCGAVYNLIFNPPEERNVCDECGGRLYQRED